MGSDKFIAIEVVYASATAQQVISLKVEVDSTIETAIDRSGIIEIFPEIDLMKQKVGVFGKLRKLTDKIKDGERIEIYRPLLIDPKEARRKRAAKNKQD